MKEIDFSSLLKILLRDYSLSISEFASSVHSSEEEINACLNGSKPSHHLFHSKLYNQLLSQYHDTLFPQDNFVNILTNH